MSQNAYLIFKAILTRLSQKTVVDIKNMHEKKQNAISISTDSSHFFLVSNELRYIDIKFADFRIGISGSQKLLNLSTQNEKIIIFFLKKGLTFLPSSFITIGEHYGRYPLCCSKESEQSAIQTDGQMDR